MALHPKFPSSPYTILDPEIRWFPADEALRRHVRRQADAAAGAILRKKVKEWRDSGYVGATDTSKSLLNWWFNTPHLLPQPDGTMAEFQYYFAQREALETIIYLYDVVGVKDKYDLMRFDSSGAGLRRHVRRNLAALCGEDGDRHRQDQGAEPGAGVELFPQDCMSRIRAWRATFW